MRIFIAGICGFVGSSLAHYILENRSDAKIIGMDNFLRPGSWINRPPLLKKGVDIFHGDLREPADYAGIGALDWVIDAAALTSVMAGADGSDTPHQVFQHNLFGTANLAALAHRTGAGLVFLSSSRVYSIPAIRNIELKKAENRYQAVLKDGVTVGLSHAGITEMFSTQSPVSFYGASKLACEKILLEYSEAFQMPVHINRCGVLAGPGQFARPDQGIVPFWIHSWQSGRSLKYIGFDGEGRQVRDCLHAHDLARLVLLQIATSSVPETPILNVSGGLETSFSLREMSCWCSERFGPHSVHSAPDERPYDVPWLVLDSSRATDVWGWAPSISIGQIFEDVARFAEDNPQWIELCA